MKTLKLRCWSPDNQEMYYPDENYSFRVHQNSITYQPHYESEDLTSFCTDPSDYEKRIEVMEFIGFVDKNRKDLYAGDIISGYRAGSNSDKSYTGVIEWRQDQCGWMIRCGKYLMEIISLAMQGDGEYTMFSHFEVVGNIYQNPDLIS